MHGCPDLLLYARISGICAGQASDGPLTAEQEAAAVAELAAEAAGWRIRRPSAPGRRMVSASGSTTRAAGG
jgi:hypothetical protein